MVRSSPGKMPKAGKGQLNCPTLKNCIDSKIKRENEKNLNA